MVPQLNPAQKLPAPPTIVKQQESETRLIEKKKLQEAVDKYNKGEKTINRRMEIKRELKESVVGKPPYMGKDATKAKALDKKFNIAVLKGTSDPDVVSLIYAETNAQKVALLKDIRERQTEAYYKELRKLLLDNKIVSINVFREVER